MRQLNGVCVPHHVVRKDDISLAREADAEGRSRVERLVVKAAIRPMSMRVEDTRMLGSAIAWPIEIAPEMNPGSVWMNSFSML